MNRVSESRGRPAVSILLILGFLAAAAWFVRSNWDEIAALRPIGAPYVLAVGLFFLINVVLRGLFTMNVLKALQVHIGVDEALGLAGATTMMNMILPLRTGAGYRALYLRRHHDLPLSLFASTMAALYLLFLFVESGVGLFAVAWIYIATGSHSVSLTMGLLLLFLGCGWVIFAFPRSSWIKGRIGKRLERTMWGWGEIVKSPRLLGLAVLIVVGCSISATAGCYCAFQAFGLPIDLPGSVLMMSSQQIGGLLSVTPGALGFQELVGLYFATILSASTTQTFVVLGSMRLIRILTSILVGIPCLVMVAHIGRRTPVVRGPRNFRETET